LDIYSLAYASTSCLDDLVLDPKTEIDNILQVAQLRNAPLGVTGALMFNERHFAQLLEGSREAVLDIYAAIERDPRHQNVAILGIKHGNTRRFVDWAMIYVGTSIPAKAYYKDYVADRIRWGAMKNDEVGALLVRLMLMDDAKAPTIRGAVEH
jgi:hypothetical protein